MLEQLFEALYEGELRVISLKEVISRETMLAEDMTPGWDKQGYMRMKRGHAEVDLPAEPEALRKRLTVLVHVCLFCKIRAPNKPAFVGLELHLFSDYSDFLLGEQVSCQHAKDETRSIVSSPSWQLVRSYEHQVRKCCISDVNKGFSMKDAMNIATKNGFVKDRFFNTPCMLAVKAQRGGQRGSQWQSQWNQGKGSKGIKGDKGKGKGKGKSKGKGAGGRAAQADWKTHLMVAAFASPSTTRARSARVHVASSTCAAAASLPSILRMLAKAWGRPRR